MKAGKILASIALSTAVLLSSLSISASADANTASAVETKNNLVLIPSSAGEGRPGEFGNAVGSTFQVGNYWYQNFEGGCIVADKNFSSNINRPSDLGANWRMIGGANFKSDGTLDTTGSYNKFNGNNDYIRIEDDNSFNDYKTKHNLTQTKEEINAMFRNAYEAFGTAGFSVGSCNGRISQWDGILRMDFRFGTSTASANNYQRSFNTVLVLNLAGNKVVAIANEFAQVYQPTTFGIPVDNAKEMTINDETVTAQVFEKGIMISSKTAKQKILLQDGTVHSYYEIPAVTRIANMTVDSQGNMKTVAISDANLETAVYLYNDYNTLTNDQTNGMTEDEIVNAFIAKYKAVVASDFSMGVPSGTESVHVNDGILMQEWEYTSDPGDGYEGRVDSLLLLNAKEKKVYYTHGAILSVFLADDQQYGGNVKTIMGAPKGDIMTDDATGTTYQNFEGGYIAVKGSEKSVVTGKYYGQVDEQPTTAPSDDTDTTTPSEETTTTTPSGDDVPQTGNTPATAVIALVVFSIAALVVSKKQK